MPSIQFLFYFMVPIMYYGPKPCLPSSKDRNFSVLSPGMWPNWWKRMLNLLPNMKTDMKIGTVKITRSLLGFGIPLFPLLVISLAAFILTVFLILLKTFGIFYEIDTRLLVLLISINFKVNFTACAKNSVSLLMTFFLKCILFGTNLLSQNRHGLTENMLLYSLPIVISNGWFTFSWLSLPLLSPCVPLFFIIFHCSLLNRLFLS